MPDYTEFGRAELNGWSEPDTAKAYATGFASAAEQCVPDLVRAVKARPGLNALDLCCGQGIVSKGLAQAGAKVQGLDFSPAMIALARAAVPDVEFIEGDATSLPFEDGTFDAVTMGFGILHIPDAEQALREVRRVLRPNGHFAYSVWQGPEVSPAFRIMFGTIGTQGDPSITLPPAPPLHQFADPSIAFPALEKAGFASPVLETTDCVWLADDPGRLFDYFLEGTVRGALLLRAQPEAYKSAIRAAVVDAVRAEFGDSAPWRIPIPAAVVSARA